MKIFGTRRNALHYNKRRSKGFRVFLVMSVLALLITGGVYALMNLYVRPPEVQPFVFAPREAPAISAGFAEEYVEEPPAARERFTVLIAGQDNMGNIGLTDTLMLAAIDTSNGAVNVVNIPRDTMVDVSWPDRKINSVFAMTSSIERLMEEVGRLTGFLPDFYVTVNLRALSDLVDVLGGVNFNVPIRMRYDDPYQSPPLHISLDPGYQLIDGAQALQVVRFRQNNDGTGYANADIGRIETQQAFLRAISAELLQIRNVTRVGQLAGIFLEHVGTNLPLGNMIYFATELMGIDSADINFRTMPGEYGVWTHGGLYVVLEIEPWLEMVNTYLNPFPVDVTEENVRVFTRVDGVIDLLGGGVSLTPLAEN